MLNLVVSLLLSKSSSVDFRTVANYLSYLHRWLASSPSSYSLHEKLTDTTVARRITRQQSFPLLNRKSCQSGWSSGVSLGRRFSMSCGPEITLLTPNLVKFDLFTEPPQTMPKVPFFPLLPPLDKVFYTGPPHHYFGQKKGGPRPGFRRLFFEKTAVFEGARQPCLRGVCRACLRGGFRAEMRGKKQGNLME